MTQKDEVAQLEESLAQMELELQSHYCQMGKQLLELAGSEQKTVGTLVDAIVKTRKKLVLAKHEIECPNCITFNSVDSKYCKRCGTPLSRANGGSQEKEDIR